MDRVVYFTKLQIHENERPHVLCIGSGRVKNFQKWNSYWIHIDAILSLFGPFLFCPFLFLFCPFLTLFTHFYLCFVHFYICLLWSFLFLFCPFLSLSKNWKTLKTDFFTRMWPLCTHCKLNHSVDVFVSKNYCGAQSMVIIM